jgi:hypothetical protein
MPSHLVTCESFVDDVEREASRRRELRLPDIRVQIPHPPIPGEQRVEEEAGEGGLAGVLGPADDDDRWRGLGGGGGGGGGSRRPFRRDDHLGARRRRGSSHGSSLASEAGDGGGERDGELARANPRVSLPGLNLIRWIRSDGSQSSYHPMGLVDNLWGYDWAVSPHVVTRECPLGEIPPIE